MLKYGSRLKSLPEGHMGQIWLRDMSSTKFYKIYLSHNDHPINMNRGLQPSLLRSRFCVGVMTLKTAAWETSYNRHS